MIVLFLIINDTVDLDSSSKCCNSQPLHRGGSEIFLRLSIGIGKHFELSEERKEESICFHQVGAVLLSDPGFCPARPAMHIHSIQQLVLSCPKDELLHWPPTFHLQAVHYYTKI